MTQGELFDELRSTPSIRHKGEARPVADTPELPYPEPGGAEYTSGHSGSDTSRERAQSEDRKGVTHWRQNRTLGFLAVQAEEGVTVKDLREITGWHHGQASSTLSVLHKAGKIERLHLRRDRCAVYVLPEYVEGRATAGYNRNRTRSETKQLEQATSLLHEVLRQHVVPSVVTMQERDRLYRKIEEFLDDGR